MSELSRLLLSVPIDMQGVVDLEGQSEESEHIHDYAVDAEEEKILNEHGGIEALRPFALQEEHRKQMIFDPAKANALLDALENMGLGNGAIAAAAFEARTCATYALLDFA